MARKMTMKDATQLINRLFIQTDMLRKQADNILGILSQYITFREHEEKFREYLEAKHKEQEDAADKIRRSLDGNKDIEESDKSSKTGKQSTGKATKTSG